MANWNAELQSADATDRTAVQSGVGSDPAFGKTLRALYYKLSAYDSGAGEVFWISQVVSLSGAPPPIGVYSNLAIEATWLV
jgi:hypothetical protein